MPRRQIKSGNHWACETQGLRPAAPIHSCAPRQVRLDHNMDAAETIRHAVAQVARLRKLASGNPALGGAVRQIKQIQSRRFASTYADLIAGDDYGAAARFFLDELYGETNYEQRDAQFSRIAGALQRLLPKAALATAVSLAELHGLSEDLDHAMAQAWLIGALPADSCEAKRYVWAWRDVGRREDRTSQLRVVLAIGAELDRLTRKPGLRLMLKMMRRPAVAAGLGALQHFLEVGFDTFASMGERVHGAQGFLAIVRERESRLIDMLFDARAASCEIEIARIMSGCAAR